MTSHLRVLYGYFWCSVGAAVFATAPERNYNRISSSTTITPRERFVVYCVDRAIEYLDIGGTTP